MRPLVLALLLALTLACGQPKKNNVEQGQALYQRTCAICHGANAAGMPGLGKGLKANAFVAKRTEAELVEFFKVGRRASDPLNETGVNMPPRGGNQALTDEDLAAIAAYLKTLR